MHSVIAIDANLGIQRGKEKAKGQLKPKLNLENVGRKSKRTNVKMENFWILGISELVEINRLLPI